MRDIGAEFLTVLPAYLEPGSFAADNARPLRTLSHRPGFSFPMTPSSPAQAKSGAAFCPLVIAGARR
jgi:hypothetical protein